MEYLDIFKGAVIPVIVAVISSGALTAVINNRSHRKDELARLESMCKSFMKNCDRQAEGLSVVMESMAVLLEVMHERGLVNGESEHVRQSINSYLMTCTERGLYMTEEKKK